MENAFANIRLVQNGDGSSQQSSPEPPPLDLGPVVVRNPVFDQPVNTVTGTTSTVGKSPAAVFVVTPEMIRRSGAQTLTEALRMVPGVLVTNTNSSAPNVTIRGMGNSDGVIQYVTRRVLVLIDGREVYDPVVGGVLWSTNDLVLQDIERIEVIRGPGATLWGSNAVNGVINIITKSAKDTQGTLLEGVGGSHYKTLATVRNGTQISENTYLRVFGKFRDISDGRLSPNITNNNQASMPNDGFHDFRTGFRIDTEHSKTDTITTQGAIYDNPNSSPNVFPGTDILAMTPTVRYSGGNMQSQWNHVFENDSQLMVMGIFDRSSYADPAVDFTRNSLAVRSTYQWAWGERHKWLAGARYRHDEDSTYAIRYSNSLLLPFPAVRFVESFSPDSRSYYVADWLIQDEIQLIPDDLVFTAGTKMEVNSFSNFQIQPSGRLVKTIDDRRVAWAAVSRAVRRPNRLNQNAEFVANTGGAFTTSYLQNSKLQADSLAAFETGYRSQPVEWLTWDVTGFYNLYDHFPQIVQVPSAPLELVLTAADTMNVSSYGTELSATVEMTDKWKIQGSYSLIQIEATSKHFRSALFVPDFGKVAENFLEQGGARNIAYVRNSWSPIDKVDIDLINRYVDSIPAYYIPAYTEMDLRFAWRPKPRLELAVMGMNLLHASHLEYGFGNIQRIYQANVIRTQVPRGVYGSVTYEF